MDTDRRDLYRLRAGILKAVAHPIRLAIMDALRDGPECVHRIAEAVDSERSNISRHLSVMVAAGILESRKDGLNVYYSLRTPCIMNFFSCVDTVLKEDLRARQSVVGRL